MIPTQRSFLKSIDIMNDNSQIDEIMMIYIIDWI